MDINKKLMYERYRSGTRTMQEHSEKKGFTKKSSEKKEGNRKFSLQDATAVHVIES
jgi:hypothetical protein